MDLLGSILGSMTGPPSATEKEKAERKKAKEMAKKMEERQREQSKVFRKKMEEKIDAFVKQTESRCLTLPPMTKYERSVVHDVAEVAGSVVAHSFGVEDEDRHSVLWKKEDPPCDDELACLKAGKAWDPAQNEREKQEKLRLDILEEKEEKERAKNNKKFVPKTNYREKYQHLIGAEATVVKPGDASRSATFGLVSAEEKKDRRTMEQIQADIKAKRKARAEQLYDLENDGEEGPTASAKVPKL